MSFFCEQINIQPRKYKDLILQQIELNEKRENINIELFELKKKCRKLEKDVINIDKNLKIILNEIKIHKDMEELNNIINEDIKKIDGFDLLSEDEMIIITSKMDKTDYRKYGVLVRFIDLERICKEVIEIKKTYPKWTLTNLESGTQQDTMPPDIFYKYEYKDEYGRYFDIGGIKVISSK